MSRYDYAGQYPPPSYGGYSQFQSRGRYQQHQYGLEGRMQQGYPPPVCQVLSQLPATRSQFRWSSETHRVPAEPAYFATSGYGYGYAQDYNLEPPYPRYGDLQSAPLISPMSNPGQHDGFNRIIAIPSADNGPVFLRAYPPLLSSFGIQRDLFLQFLDDMNGNSTVAQSLQILGKVGTVIGFAPLPSLQAAGTAMSVVSKLGGAIASKGHTGSILGSANETIFGPKGLTVSVISISDLAGLTGMPVTRDGVLILTPQINSDMLSNLTIQQRRLKALDPWIAPLELHEQSTPTGNQMGGILGGQRKPSKQDKLHQDYDEKMQELDYKEDEARRQGKDLGKVQREREKLQGKFESKFGKSSFGNGLIDDGMKKVLFLVVTVVN